MRALLPWIPLALALVVPPPAQAIPQCPTPEHRAELSGFEERLLEAEDVEEARSMALKKVDRTRRAVDHAARIVPNDTELQAHQAALDDFAADVAQAKTQQEVASGFADLRTQSVGAKCYYSTGEIIAVVLGFILGVIPGIILLILLC